MPERLSPPPPLRVAVSVVPQGYFVRRIAGSRTAVTVMIPPGSEEETFSPAPGQLGELASARLYLAVGHPGFTFERRWIEPFLRGRRDIRCIDTSRGMRLLEPGGPGPAGPGRARLDLDHNAPSDPRATDPHLWVAPETVAVAARNIAAALIQADPGFRDLYLANLRSFLADLAGVDVEIRQVVARARRRAFLVDHPAWGYFAREYGLRQIALEAGGKEPGAATLVRLITGARTLGIHLVLVQPAFSPKSAEIVAAELRGRVVEVDPMGADWLATMKRMRSVLQETLGAD